MRLTDFTELSINELWDIRQLICDLLTQKLMSEKKRKVELPLRELSSNRRQEERERLRHHPKVLPRFRNHEDLNRTRKSTAVDQQDAGGGQTLDDLRISRAVKKLRRESYVI